MQTNPNQYIHTDYKLNDVFKPEAANQLARAIHYDFVITQEMLDKYLERMPSTTSIDVGTLIAMDWDDPMAYPWGAPIKAPISIYISAKTSANDQFTFDFWGRLIGGSSSDGHIVDCSDYMVNGNWDAELTKDMINVYSAHPYRVGYLTAGCNHWSTPTAYVSIKKVSQNNGIAKIGTYYLEGPQSDYTYQDQENLQIVCQDYKSFDFVINPSQGHVVMGYRPLFVHANWMGGGGGVTTEYYIRGTDMSDPTTSKPGLYQQLAASASEWNTEPILAVQHNQYTSRYQLCRWDSYKFEFSNVVEGKSVTVHQNGDVEWGEITTGSRGGSSDIIIFQDDGVMIPYKKGAKFVSLDPRLVETDNQVRYSLYQNGQFTTYNSQTADVPLFKVPNSSNNNGLRPYGTNHIVWNTWFAITAYSVFEGDPTGASSHIETFKNGSIDSSIPGHNNLARMYIVTDALVEGLVYEVVINIRAIATTTESETGSSEAGTPYGLMLAPDRYEPHFGLVFFTSDGYNVIPRRWADSTRGCYFVVRPRFNRVPSDGDGTGFQGQHGGIFHTSDSGIAPILATAKVYFVRMGSDIFVMSY